MGAKKLGILVSFRNFSISHQKKVRDFSISHQKIRYFGEFSKFFYQSYTHLRKIDWNTKKISSKNTWSTWTRKSYGVQRYPAWVWVGPALGLRAKLFKIWSHGTKKFCSKISLHKVRKVPWRYFVGFWRQDSFSGLTG